MHKNNETENFTIRFKEKGIREKIHAAAKACGLSANNYLVKLISEDVKKTNRPSIKVAHQPFNIGQWTFIGLINPDGGADYYHVTIYHTNVRLIKFKPGDETIIPGEGYSSIVMTIHEYNQLINGEI